MKKRYNPIGISPRNLSRAERRMGRLMRSPDGHEAENSGGENSAEAGTGENDQNKAGQEEASGAFWEVPKAEPKNSEKPKDESDANSLGTQIQAHLDSQNFGIVMDEKTMTELAGGKFDSFNAAVNKTVQAAAKESMGLTIKILEQFGSKVMEAIDAKVKGNLETRDNQDFLTREIPASADPLLRPMFQQIYEQALRLSNGNRQLAIAKTKQVAAGFVSKSAKDVGVEIGSRTDRDESNPGANINWVELMASKP